MFMHIQDFLGPFQEKCPQNLQKLADKERKKLLKEKLQRERKVYEKELLIAKQKKKLIRDKMEEDLQWRQQLTATK